jgi:uncharacterized glyoxalase superfamily protein PhnB
MCDSFEILGIQSILVCPQDWDTSMRFWRDTLGLEVAADWSDDHHGAAALRFGNSHLIVAGQEEKRDHDLGFPVEHGKIYIYVQVKGLDALVAHLQSKNNSEIHGPVQLHWGPRLATTNDPEGVPVMFVEGDPNATLVARYSQEHR